MSKTLGIDLTESNELSYTPILRFKFCWNCNKGDNCLSFFEKEKKTKNVYFNFRSQDSVTISYNSYEPQKLFDSAVRYYNIWTKNRAFLEGKDVLSKKKLEIRPLKQRRDLIEKTKENTSLNSCYFPPNLKLGRGIPKNPGSKKSKKPIKMRKLKKPVF